MAELITSTLTSKDFNDFWIRVYLHTSKNLIGASIDRAYRDFNRTLHGIREDQTKEKYLFLRTLMKEIVNEITNTAFLVQEKYDDWHKEKCDTLILEFSKTLFYKLTYGQAQKWINMTLKYLFALGEERIPGISMNYQFFHIPIDNIIREKLAEIGIPMHMGRWSRWDNYIEYLEYQKLVRNKFANQIPMDVEFRLYNASDSL